jgi:SOS-response transcriptional repressor LexA
MESASDRLKRARIDRGYATAVEAADAMGLPRPTYMSHENGLRGLPAARAAKYARFFGVTPEWLLYGRSSGGNSPQTDNLGAIKGLKPVSRDIPVVGIVSAGLWRETGLAAVSEAQEYIALDVAGYERASLSALLVEGNSMNLHYPAGRYIIVAPVAEAGVRDGDHVVVERRRAGLVEITVKELVIEGDRQALWPRSTDPAFQSPIYVTGDEHDQDAPQIIAVVVADYGRRVRPPVLLPHPRFRTV